MVFRSLKHGISNNWIHLPSYLPLVTLWLLVHAIFYILFQLYNSNGASFPVETREGFSLSLILDRHFYERMVYQNLSFVDIKKDLLNKFHYALMLGGFLHFNPFTALLYQAVYKNSQRKRFSLIECLLVFRKDFLPTLQIGIILLLAILVSITSIRFYRNFFEQIPFFGNTASLLALSLLVLFFAVNMHSLPLLIRENKTFIQIIKRGYMLTLENTFHSLFQLFLFASLWLALIWQPRFLPLTLLIYLLWFIPFNHKYFVSLIEKYGMEREGSP